MQRGQGLGPSPLPPREQQLQHLQPQQLGGEVSGRGDSELACWLVFLFIYTFVCVYVCLFVYMFVYCVFIPFSAAAAVTHPLTP